jgi:hypothetical protein
MILDQDKKINRAAFDEFPGLLCNSIWENSSGNYTVFGRYSIVKEKTGYRVHCSLTDVGVFYSTRSALSWCIADKFKKYNLARELVQLDSNLHHMTADIAVRAAIGNRVKDADAYEIILAKLENKILQKKEIENRLVKCINSAKYYQQQGFDNETARTSRTVANKTNR